MRDQWNRHEALLLEYERAWTLGSRPQVSLFLDGVASADADELDFAYLAVELSKIDLERRLRQGDAAARTESYLVELPELLSPEARRLDLLSHELDVRDELGAPATDSELRQRFPEDASELKTRVTSVATTPKLPGPMPRPGESLKQYQLEEIVGSGSFAVVFRARDTRLNRQVAIKLLRPRMARPEIQRRMQREALATASLNHHNVVPIIEIDSIDGHDYIVSHFVNGPTLEEVLDYRQLSIGESVRIVEALADALAEAHEHGIVHRDMKPANVLMEGDEPRITDFGLASLGEASVHLTNEGDVLGTPAYMPPEQASGNAWQADPRSDIYSVGVILYRLTTGKLPFEGHAASVIQQVINKEPPHPRKLRKAIPRDIQTIVLKCLEKEPADRYQTAHLLANDLRAFVSGHSIAAKPSGPASRLWKWSRRRPAQAVTSAVAMLLLSVALGFGLQYGRTRELLAQSSATAGTLAMQRGQSSAAIVYFDQAIEQGHPHPEQLRLEKLKPLVTLGRLEQAQSELEVIQAHGRLPENLNGELLLWRAEMALIQRGIEAEVLFEQALDDGLGPADQAYAEAMLSTDSSTCVERLTVAVSADRFHHRARRMLSLMLFSLARFDQAGESIRTGMSLYPDDDDFRLINALWHASQDKLETSELEIAGTQLDEPDRALWLEFCHSIHFLSNRLVPYPEASAHWAKLARDFEEKYLPLTRARYWCFPMRIARRFAELPALLAATSSAQVEVTLGHERDSASVEPARQLSATLKQLVAIHPEASLFLLLGITESSLNYVTPDAESGWAELSLEAAQEAFLGSRDYPGFVAEKDQHMYDGLISTSLMLWIGGRDVDRSRSLFIDAAKKLHPRYIDSLPECRALAVASLRTEVDELAVRWCEHYLLKYPEERDAIWHAAIMYERQGNLSAALKLARKLVRRDRDDQEAIALLARFKRLISEQLENESLEALAPNN